MTVLCPACSTENREGARFCKGCGGKLAGALTSPAVQDDWATTAPAPLREASTSPGLFDPSVSASGAGEKTVIGAAGGRAPQPLPRRPELPAAPHRAPPQARASIGPTAPTPRKPVAANGSWLGMAGLVAALIVAAGGGWYVYTGRTGATGAVVAPIAAFHSTPMALPAPATATVLAPPALVPATETIAAAPLPTPPAAEPAPKVVPPAARPAAPPAAAAAKPRKVAPPPVVPVAVAPAPPVVPAPAPAPEPAPPVAPQAGCAGRNFIAMAQCMAAQCLKSEFMAHPQCEAVRQQQRREDERRNLY